MGSVRGKRLNLAALQTVVCGTSSARDFHRDTVNDAPNNCLANGWGARREFPPAGAVSLLKQDKWRDAPGVGGALQFRLDFHDNDTIRDANPGEGLFMPAKNHDAHVAKFCLASFLPYRLAVVTESIHRLFGESYQETCDLTIPEWRALAIVAE